MLSSAVLAASVLAEEEVHELPVQPYWFAIVAFCLFVLLAVVVASFSGRGVPRQEAGPGDLSADEQDALAEYRTKFPRH